MNWRRIVPLTGLVFAVLLVVSFIVAGDTPDPDASAEEVASFYTSNDTSQGVSALLGGVAGIFFLFFLGILRGELRRHEQGPGVLSATAFAGGIVLSVGGAAFAGFTLTLADTADDIDPSAIQALNALSGDFFVPLAVGVIVFLIAAGIAIVRTGALAAWLGWAAIVIGILWVTPAFFVAGPGALLWVAVVSVLLSMRAGAPELPAAARPGPQPTPSGPPT
jgi:hypothetical protein